MLLFSEESVQMIRTEVHSPRLHEIYHRIVLQDLARESPAIVEIIDS